MSRSGLLGAVSRNGLLCAAVALSISWAHPSARAERVKLDDGDPPPKLSLPTETDRAAWQLPGFRLQLGASYGRALGLDGAPDASLVGAVLRVGARLDQHWSLLGSFQYTLAGADVSGLRYSGTIEPTWHITRRWSAALGLGVGGIVEGRRTGRVDPEPRADSLETSFTFPDASTPIASCKGAGVTGLARVDWMLVLGPRTSTGLGLELFGQWTRCIDDSGRVEPDTAEPIVRRQFWPHVGVNLGWVVAWR